eukprot:9487344-Alexandrium_andersonii.AAC.1
MHPSGASGTILRPLLGPRGSRFERLKRCCVFRRAGCGLGRIAALAGLGLIADCILGTLQCKDPSLLCKLRCV